MKSIFTLIAFTTILASLSVSTSVAQIEQPHSFILEATGTAYDRQNNPTNIDLSLEGYGFGTLSRIMWLRVDSGNMKVGTGTFRIVGGQGLLTQSAHYIYLVIRITPLYGGTVTACYMRGTTDDPTDSEIPLSLSSRYLILPTPPRITILRNLQLTGEITLT